MPSFALIARPAALAADGLASPGVGAAGPSGGAASEPDERRRAVPAPEAITTTAATTARLPARGNHHRQSRAPGMEGGDDW